MHMQEMWRPWRDAFSKTAMKEVTHCSGRRPWLSENDASCDQTPRTLQRGASNVWFSLMHSAISIPPWSEGAFLVLNKHWEMLRHLRDQEALRAVLESMRLAEGTIFSTDDLVAAVIQRQVGEAADDDDMTRSLKRDEYAGAPARETRTVDRPAIRVRARRGSARLALRSDRARDAGQEAQRSPGAGIILQGHSAGCQPASCSDRHFSTPTPAGSRPSRSMARASSSPCPADALERWERDDRVVKRVSQINDNYRARFAAHGGLPDREITPRLMLIHSLAHAVIDQWALDSGYPASALRERLYVDDDMAGFLIYTATSDSAGSLGGVIAEAEPDRLEASFREPGGEDRLVFRGPAMHRERTQRRRCPQPCGLPFVHSPAREQLRRNEHATGPGPARRVALSARARIPAAKRIRDLKSSMAKMLPSAVRDGTSSPAEHAMFAHMRDELSGDWTVLHSLGLTILTAGSRGQRSISC